MAKSAAAALHTEPKEPNFLQKFGHDFVHGDIFTKLSFFVWGLGYIGHGQLMKALTEAVAHKGPSIIIAYAPCINHGIKGGMSNSQLRAKQAVEAGYWHCYRYNPELRGEGKNPFSLDSKAPTGSFRDFLMGEVRYSSLYRKFPEIADQLFAKAQRDAEERTETYLRLAGK